MAIIIPLLIILMVWAWLWPNLRDWFSTKVIPWLKGHFSETVGEWLGHLVSWLDNVHSASVRVLKSAINFFNTRILKATRKYVKDTSSMARRIDEIIIHKEDGKFVRQVSEEEVAWEDLPYDVRQEFIKRNTNEADINLKEVILEKVKEKAKKEELILQLSEAF